MIIIAKYPGKCRICGGATAAGQEVRWGSGQGTEHVRCPEGPKRKPSPPPAEGEFSVARPSRSRDDGYKVGECVYFSRVSGGCYGVIVAAGKQRDDDADRWDCWARVRPATEAEIAPVRARREVAARKAEDIARLQAIHERISRARNADAQQIEGRRIVVERQPMGATSTITIAGDTIYAVHPGHYDDWRASYGVVTDAVLALEVIAIADRLGL